MIVKLIPLLFVVVPLLAQTTVNSLPVEEYETIRTKNHVEVIAHRGFWVDNAQNSREALAKAQAIGVYGSETDVWLTVDNRLMVNHDSSYDGIVIKSSTSDECKKLTLSNGETMPELTDFLTMIASSGSSTKLIIEIKDHGTVPLNRAAATATLAAVRDYGVEDKVEYISFSATVCEQIIKEAPAAKVSYLSGDLAPALLHARGYTGIDYNIDVLRTHPQWVEEAHNLGMTVNAWTITTRAALSEMLLLGVDYITTDIPHIALKEIDSTLNSE